MVATSVEGRWGVFPVRREPAAQATNAASVPFSNDLFWCVHLAIGGDEIMAEFASRTEALAYQESELASRLGWKPGGAEAPRNNFDHSADLEELKAYSFLEIGIADAGGERSADACAAKTLSCEQVVHFNDCGFIGGIPVFGEEDLAQLKVDFDSLVAESNQRAKDEVGRFRAGYHINRPLHQELVHSLATDVRILDIVEDILGPRFVCWSAHLFCKQPDDPHEVPYHQDAGFWPFDVSRSVTLWIAFDDVGADNSPLTFVCGSHRLGPIKWSAAASEMHTLAQEIPNATVFGPARLNLLRAGEVSVHCDTLIHGSAPNISRMRRGGLALRYTAAYARCVGPFLNGYELNKGCILARGCEASDGHWKSIRKRGGGKSRKLRGTNADNIKDVGPGSVSISSDSGRVGKVSPEGDLLQDALQSAGG